MRLATRSSAVRGDADDRRRPEPALGLTMTPIDTASKREPRSSYGSVPGAELPTFVYVSVVAAFAWIMLAAWLAFSGQMDADLVLGVGVVLAIMFFGLPIIIHRVAIAHARKSPETTGDFLTAPVDIATGPLTGRSAWLQVALIPVALALAATLIGGAFVLAR